MNSQEINQDNFDYLAKQITFTGFNTVDPRELEKQMKADKNEFSIDVHTMVGQDKLDVQLNFGKAKNPSATRDSDYYFFNSYDVKLSKEGAEESLGQSFKVSYGNSYTLREAYNMMEGRSVNKDFISVNWDNRDEDKTINAWAYLNFKQARDDGKGFEIRKAFNFDIEKALSQLPIKDFDIPNVKHTIIDNLQKGNYQQVKFDVEGKEVKQFIEAAPRYNSVNIYDENMVRQYLVAPKEKIQNQGEQMNQGQQKSEMQSEKQPDQKKERVAKQENLAKTNKPVKKQGRKVR